MNFGDSLVEPLHPEETHLVALRSKQPCWVRFGRLVGDGREFPVNDPDAVCNGDATDAGDQYGLLRWFGADTYLVGLEAVRRSITLALVVGFSDVLKAVDLLDEAVKRDRSFFDAYCQLAYAHECVYVTGSDHTPARLALAETALQAATRLRPDAGETHLARAQYLYRGRRDYSGALAELESARRALPNDPRLFELTGYNIKQIKLD